jgi:hypothetical protein
MNTCNHTDIINANLINNTNSGPIPLYAEGEMVTHQYIAIQWTRSLAQSGTKHKYYVAQVVHADGSGENHVFVVRYQQVYLNFSNGWKLTNKLDKEDLEIITERNILYTGNEIVYKGLVTYKDKILLINMVPVQMKPYMALIKECNVFRAWSPLGAKVPVGAPLVIRRSKSHGGPKSRGIFASEDIPCSINIGEYRGDVEYHPPGHLFQTNISCYVLDVGPISQEINYYIVAGTPKCSAWTRFINQPNSNEVANVIFTPYKTSIDHPKVQKEFCVLVQTVKNIKKGEQLLVSYECTQ